LSPFSLAGKTALVAGASRGIGLAIAKGMAAAGARTILAARSREALETAAGEIRTAGGQAEAVPMDVADSASIRAATQSMPEIDILVNVAGINIRKRFLDYTREEYDRILQTNLHGIIELTQQVGGGMVARGSGGKIVNIGSEMSWMGLPYLGPYAISKSGLAGMTRVLAAEWGRYNIQVNCIAPGFIATDLNRHILQGEEFQRWVRGAQASPRLGAPEDVAPLAVFLSSPGSDYITGQLIAVDGGYSTVDIWPFEP
jgi:gluconate 5-dehydrogenase